MKNVYTITVAVDESLLGEDTKENEEVILSTIESEKCLSRNPAIRVIDMTPGNDILFESMKNEVLQTSLSMEIPLSDRELRKITDEFIDDDHIWQKIHSTMGDNISEFIGMNRSIECAVCGIPIRIGDEAYKADDTIYCSESCMDEALKITVDVLTIEDFRRNNNG